MLQLPFKVVLSSKSPRRQELLKVVVQDFDIKVLEVEEVYPHELEACEVAEYLAKLKLEPFLIEEINEMVITSDTTVCIKGEVLGKPKDKEDAIKMLKLLSGATHQVITGVAFYHPIEEKVYSFSDITNVTFKDLSEKEIEFYIDNYQPFDKAGAYGVQEWIGQIGISNLNGCYYNVMGLPIHRLYQELSRN